MNDKEPDESHAIAFVREKDTMFSYMRYRDKMILHGDKLCIALTVMGLNAYGTGCLTLSGWISMELNLSGNKNC